MTRPLLAVLLTLSINFVARTQPAKDSTSSAGADSVTVIDSVQIRYIPGLGEIAGVGFIPSLSQDHLRWTDSKNLTEALSRMTDNSILELGEEGQSTDWWIAGDGSRANSLLMDGRSMNDPATGAITLSDFPLEFIDEIQALTTPQRVFASSAAGTSFNIVPRSYNSLRPITRIRFLQDPKETMLTDVFFSQNILRGVNLLFGFQRQAAQGRYTNGALNEWNLRTRIRWNANERVNVALTHLYLKSTLGMSGGVDPTQSGDPFQVDDARPVNESAYGIRERHDLTLAGVGRFLGDSSATTKAVAYLTTVDREYTSPPITFVSERLSAFLRSQLMGVRIEQRICTSIADISLAAEQEWRGTENTGLMPFSSEFRSAATVLVTLNAFSGLRPSVSMRTERMTKVVRSSIVMGLSYGDSSALSLDADFSDSYRFPTLQEVYWTDSLFVRRTIPTPEHHRAVRIGGSYALGNFGTIAITLTRKAISNALVFRPDTTAFGTSAIGLDRVAERSITSASAAMSLAISTISFTGAASVVSMKDDGSSQQAVPGIILNGEVAYQGGFFVDALTARVGVRAMFSDRFRGAEFDARTGIFFENVRYQLGRTTVFDAFGVFHVGDAYITLAFLNLLSAERLTVPVYPLPPRQFRLGVNWTFLD